MWWRRQEHEVQWTICNCYRGEHFSDNTQKWWSQHGLRKQRSAQHLWRHTDAFQGTCCSPRGSSSNIASTDERTLGDSIKNIFSQKKILSGRTTLVLIAAEQKEELVGIIVERAAAGFSPESPARDTVPLAQQMPRSPPRECPHKSASLPRDEFVLGWISNGPQSAT